MEHLQDWLTPSPIADFNQDYSVFTHVSYNAMNGVSPRKVCFESPCASILLRYRVGIVSPDYKMHNQNKILTFSM